MKIGIVGHGEDKFDTVTKAAAIDLIRKLLSAHPNSILVSGHSPVGGIDIWAEDVAQELGIQMDLKIPYSHTWDGLYGYKARNLDIAKSSDEVHVILVARYPDNYHGRRFSSCYHCHTTDHVKSGGCWTGHQAKRFGKKVKWHVLKYVEPHPTISSFEGDYRFLSNFYTPVTITHENLTYTSTEAAYQASKFPWEKRIPFTKMSPTTAKKAGKGMGTTDWHAQKVELMLVLLRQKFSQEPLKSKLLETGDAELIESNWWGDRFWGKCDGIGENNLGRLLMQVRSELK